MSRYVVVVVSYAVGVVVGLSIAAGVGPEVEPEVAVIEAPCEPSLEVTFLCRRYEQPDHKKLPVARWSKCTPGEILDHTLDSGMD